MILGIVVFFLTFIQIIFNFGFNDRLFKLRQRVKDDREIFEDLIRYMDQVNKDLEKLEERTSGIKKEVLEALRPINDQVRTMVQRTEHSIARGPQRPS